MPLSVLPAVAGKLVHKQGADRITCGDSPYRFSQQAGDADLPYFAAVACCVRQWNRVGHHYLVQLGAGYSRNCLARQHRVRTVQVTLVNKVLMSAFLVVGYSLPLDDALSCRISI